MSKLTKIYLQNKNSFINIHFFNQTTTDLNRHKHKKNQTNTTTLQYSRNVNICSFEPCIFCRCCRKNSTSFLSELVKCHNITVLLVPEQDFRVQEKLWAARSYHQVMCPLHLEEPSIFVFILQKTKKQRWKSLWVSLNCSHPPQLQLQLRSCPALVWVFFLQFEAWRPLWSPYLSAWSPSPSFNGTNALRYKTAVKLQKRLL